MTTPEGYRIPKIVRDFVSAALDSHVDAICDDPHGVFQGMTPSEIMIKLQTWDRIGEIVGQSLSAKVAERATDFEFKRLMDFVGEARTLAYGAVAGEQTMFRKEGEPDVEPAVD